MPWCDHNDRKNLEIYEKHIDKKIYVMCFVQDQESHFYWDSIGGGTDCRISFNGPKLIEKLKNTGIRWGSMNYVKLNDLPKEIKKKTFKLNDVPFLKRQPYNQEKEFRIVWEGIEQENEIKIFDINFGVIDSITLSDSIPENVANSVKEIIRKIDGFDVERLYRGTVHDNKQWLKYLEDGIKGLK